MEPREGLLTYMAEGNNISSSEYYSRKIHWPGNTSQCEKFGSGVTIGRGYDLKHRSKSEVISDLTFAGVPIEKAKEIAEGSKNSHCAAGDFVKNNRGSISPITEQQQIRLFEKTYATYLNDSIVFYHRYKKKDSVAWGDLNQALKDVLVDMKYQGRLEVGMVAVFGKNDKKEVTNLIRNSAKLTSDESARQRISYLERNMK